MFYAMADLHGEYDKYMEMLEKIGFNDDDTLFVLGDVVDRGDKPMEILRDMMMRPNVFPLMGNHDYCALFILEKLRNVSDDELADSLDESLIEMARGWIQDGGLTTLKEFLALSGEEREDILGYLDEFSLIEAIDVGERSFVLVHAGLGNFSKNRKFSDYSAEELIDTRVDYERRYFDEDDVYVVTGHTPTLTITGKAEIYKSHNNIVIDCGATYEDGRLACLCLDTLEEFYVS